MRRIAPALLLLTACAGSRAGAQGQPDDMARLHAYEVSPERLAQAAQQGYVEVSGTGSVEVEVDRALLAFSVETLRPTAAQAASINAELMESVLSALRESGFQGLELETFGYSLSPQYSRRESGQTLVTGFLAGNNVGARISDVQDVGRLIDVAIGAGANRVNRLTFGAADTESARLEALASAVENARAEAEVIAAALDRTLGEPLEVRSGGAPAAYADRGMELQLRAATPIEPGDQTVTATVTIKFALGPEREGR